MDRCHLSAVSLGCLASGPRYTYCSGEKHTIVDYILTDVDAAELVSSCRTLNKEDLNTSDHLPLTDSLMYEERGSVPATYFNNPLKINWDQACKDGSLDVFKAEAESYLTRMLNHIYDSADQVNEEIADVAKMLVSCAERNLPCVGPKRRLGGEIRH